MASNRCIVSRGERAEQIARAFHESYERQAPDFGYETREASRTAWEQIPAQNRGLMVAVVIDLLDRRIIS